MTGALRVTCLAAVVLINAAPRPVALQLTATELLDRYDRGDRDAVVEIFRTAPDVDAMRRDLEQSGKTWTKAAGASREPHRRLAAATMALELANARMRDKWVPLRSLVEWGCELLRAGPATEAERAWQLASIAVAEGALDSALLFSLPTNGRSYDHLPHALQRFPRDARIAFAAKFAIQTLGSPGAANLQPHLEPPLDQLSRSVYNPTYDTAVKKLTALFTDPEVGAEAALRVGYLQLAELRFDRAIEAFDIAIAHSQSSYVTYLAYFLEGRTFERQDKPADAKQAYARAAATIPEAQSAALAYAALLMRDGRTREANALVAASFIARPRPLDPWRLFPMGDYYRWPTLIASLRSELDQ
jgi:tetratricopeptide (TPR) repeat protein